MKKWFNTNVINLKNNYVSSSILGIWFFLWMFLICYFTVKNNLFISIDNITRDTIFSRFLFDFFALSVVALIIIVINRKNLEYFRLCIQSKYEILILAGVMILLFFLHNDYSIEGFYHFYFYLFFVAFTEEFLFRGYLYNRMREDSRKYAIIISGICFGIGHAVLPSILTNADLLQLLWAMASTIGGGILSGWYFIILQERSKTIWIPVLVHAILDYTVGIIGLLVAIITLIYFLEKTKVKPNDFMYNRLMD